MSHLLRSEWSKFWCYSWSVLGVFMAFSVPLVVTLVSKDNTQGLSALYLGQIGIVIASSGFFGQEKSCLRTTLLGNPCRLKLVTAKLLILTLIIIITGLITSISCIIVKKQFLNQTITVDLSLILIKRIGAIIMSWGQIGWITASLSIITNSLIFPIALMFSLIIGLSQLLLTLFPFAKFLPDLATMNLFIIPEISAYLSGIQGLFVQLTWSLLLLSWSLYVIQKKSVR